MRIVVTGADGFIGSNLRVRAARAGPSRCASASPARRPTSELSAALAGRGLRVSPRRREPAEGRERVRQPATPASPQTLCERSRRRAARAGAYYASSTQAALDNPYGRSKRAAEDALLALRQSDRVAVVHLFRLHQRVRQVVPAELQLGVATFCHNIARGLPITDQRPRGAHCSSCTSTTWWRRCFGCFHRTAGETGLRRGRPGLRARPSARSRRLLPGLRREPPSPDDSDASARR